MFVYDTRNQEEEKMRKNVKKVIAPLLAAAMALSCTVCVSIGIVRPTKVDSNLWESL